MKPCTPIVAAHLVVSDTGLLRIDDQATDLAHFLLTISTATVCSCTCLGICFKGFLVNLHHINLVASCWPKKYVEPEFLHAQNHA